MPNNLLWSLCQKDRNTLVLNELTVLFVCLQSGLTLNADGILGPLTEDLPAEGLDFSEEIPAAED